jgi:hypothetical protein
MKELVPQCETCSKKTGLFRCGKCKFVVYCGRDCQLQNHPDHKKQCSRLIKLHANIDRTKRELLSDPYTPPNYFVTRLGEFWGNHEARPFVRAIATYGQESARTLTTYGTKEAIKMGLETLKYVNGDNLGMRFEIPFYYLILGDAQSMQECYDFMKWWGRDEDDDYDYENDVEIETPFLSYKNEDMLEPVSENYLTRYASLYHLVAITVLKGRLLLDVMNFTMRWIPGCCVQCGRHAMSESCRGNTQ